MSVHEIEKPPALIPKIDAYDGAREKTGGEIFDIDAPSKGLAGIYPKCGLSQYLFFIYFQSG
jgi:hypothetical protein